MKSFHYSLFLALGLSVFFQHYLHAQAAGVDIVEQSPGGVKGADAAVSEKVAALDAAGELLDEEEIEKQMAAPRSMEVSLVAPATVELRPGAIAELARVSTVRVGWTYLCGKCGAWHLKLGGGYAISEDGVIASCAHVLKAPPMETGSLIVVDHAGHVFPVRSVLANDAVMDAAFVKIDAGIKPLPLSDQVRIGDEAFCFSNPLGQRKYFSRGMVNRFFWDKKDRGGDDTKLSALRHLRLNVSTPWAPGSSGSPVLDSRGNVIGHVALIQALSERRKSGRKKGEKNDAPAKLSDVEAAVPLITLHIAIPARSVKTLALVPEPEPEPKGVADEVPVEDGPAEIYSRISELMAAGKMDESLGLMTESGRKDFLSKALITVVDAVAFEDDFNEKFTLSDGTEVTATPADLGLENFEFPDWLVGDGEASVEAIQRYYSSLPELLEQAEDQEKFLRSLMLLDRDLAGSDFGGKLVAAPEGVEVDPNRLWVQIDLDDEEDLVPLRFEKVAGGWKFAGVDFQVIN